MAVFVYDDFLRDIQRTPSLWIAPELVKRLVNGKSPLLSAAEVRDGNSGAGLTLVVWHDTCPPEEAARPEVAAEVRATFVQTFRGFHLKEIFAEADSPQMLSNAPQAGGFFFDRNTGIYSASFPAVDQQTFSDEPRDFGVTRELALAHPGSWVGSLFISDRPQIGFSLSEQRLLRPAIAPGGTDEEISDHIGISLFAVKKTWRSIYDRVQTCFPQLLSTDEDGLNMAQGRGKEKKQHLLAYLREHPEELRPFSRPRKSK